MIHAWFAIFHWFQEVTGTNNGIPGHTPRWYNFSSAGLEFTAIAAAVGLYFHHVCHDDNCYRWGRHKVNGSPCCKKHKQKHDKLNL